MAKQKIKTKKTLLRRVKITKNGKLMKKSIGMGHLKAKKSVRNKKRNDKMIPQANKGHKKNFKKMLTKHAKSRVKEK
ncbi:MAG TPA: 50S ribosomal protein L35 [bacterium]|jgi:ribosomal protein L35|nr:50S ribosomal protein L35 [bacterium]